MCQKGERAEARTRPIPTPTQRARPRIQDETRPHTTHYAIYIWQDTPWRREKVLKQFPLRNCCISWRLPPIYIYIYMAGSMCIATDISTDIFGIGRQSSSSDSSVDLWAEPGWVWQLLENYIIQFMRLPDRLPSSFWRSFQLKLPGSKVEIATAKRNEN